MRRILDHSWLIDDLFYSSIQFFLSVLRTTGSCDWSIGVKSRAIATCTDAVILHLNNFFASFS